MKSMKRRKFMNLMASSLTGSALAFQGCGNGLSPDSGHIQSPGNMLVIVVDTMRADRLHGKRNGKAITPHLSAFAKRAWQFDNAIAQTSWTRPSMVSMFSSLYADVHNIQFGIAHKLFEGQDMTADVVPGELEMCARTLQSAGYRTWGIQTNPHLKSEFGFNQGFDTYEYLGPDVNAEFVTGRALEALKTLCRKKAPFCLYVHYMDPHGPYRPPAEYSEFFGTPPEISSRERKLLEDFSNYYRDMVLDRVGLEPGRETGDFSEAGQERLRYLYDCETRFTDEHVGRLIEATEQQTPDCAIALTADHGEEFWDHGGLGHGLTLYEELIRVPLIMRLPGTSPLRTSAPVECIDIFPTLAANAGIRPNRQWQGRDIRDLARVGTWEPRPQFSQTRSAQRAAGIKLQSVTLGKHKLITDHKERQERFFDLAADPLEQNPLDMDGKTAKVFRQVLDEQHAANAAHPVSALKAEQAVIDPATKEELDIGYL